MNGIRLVVLLLIAPAILLAQPTGSIRPVSVDPSGACSVAANFQYNYTNGKLWGCENGTWTAISGSGGGGSSVGSPGAIQGAGVAGAFADSGCTFPSSGTINCPNGFSSNLAFLAFGPWQATPGAPAASSSLLYFLPATGHLGWEDPSGALVDFSSAKRIAAYTFDGGGSALSGTVDACVDVPSAATITGVTLLGDQSGSATIDVRTVAYGSYTGPSSASTITASATPALSSAIKYQDTTLTGWTTAVAANTVVCFHLTSPATVTWVLADVEGILR